VLYDPDLGKAEERRRKVLDPCSISKAFLPARKKKRKEGFCIYLQLLSSEGGGRKKRRRDSSTTHGFCLRRDRRKKRKKRTVNSNLFPHPKEEEKERKG